MIEEHIKAKISQLINRARSLVAAEMLRDDYHFGECESWLVEADNVVQLAIPLAQHPYRQRIAKLADPEGKAIFRCVTSVAEILRALLADIDAGLLADFGNQIRAATGVSAYLKNGGTLERAAQMANHASTRTTQLYDRCAEVVTLDDVERILI